MDLAVIVIKPDSVRDILERSIVFDLMQTVDFDILLAKYHQFTEAQIRIMYPTWVNKSVFRYMVRNYLIGPSLILLVKGKNVSQSINDLKGKMNIGEGIRHKYKRYSVEEMERLNFSDEEINIRKSENRIHSTDYITEAWDILTQTCNARELIEISHHFKNENGLTFDLIK